MADFPWIPDTVTLRGLVLTKDVCYYSTTGEGAACAAFY